MLNIDASLESCFYTKKTIKSKDAILNFISHCCQQRHYSFTVKKCFVETCSICSPSRLPPEVYQSLHYLPDPVLSDSEEAITRVSMKFMVSRLLRQTDLQPKK